MKNIILSAIIITKNEEKTIKRCLQFVSFADEIIVVDSESTDETAKIAKSLGAKVFTRPFSNFADQRNFALSVTKGDWALYVDADEVVTNELKEEIRNVVKMTDIPYSAYKIKRKNYYFDNYEWPYIEYIERLFKKSALLGWQGEVHESPNVTGAIGKLNSYLIHYTHDDLTSMLDKTNQWSSIESKLLYDANHPSMKSWRFLRIMITKFIDSYIKKQGWKMGVAGLIESMYQSYSYFIVYAKLWERQQKKNAKTV